MQDKGGLRNTLYRTVTRSGRRMTAARRWLYRLAVPLGIAIIKTWWRTCRVVRVEGAHHLNEALAKAPSLVPCYWHQHQLYCGKFLVEQRSRGLTVGWLISPSVDGELAAMMVRRFGAAVIRGSSTHTGARALRDYYQALVKDNVSPVITPDGPRGPRRCAQPGAVAVARLSGRPIVAIGIAPERCWRLSSWDGFAIPKPFSRVNYAYGDPIWVPREGGSDADYLAQIQRELDRVTELAERSALSAG